MDARRSAIPSALLSVVSVSPRQSQPAGAAPDVFLSPRVMDQSAVRQLQEQLRALIDAAVEAEQRLGRAAGDAVRSAADLQERLALSARVLKASAGLIDRLDELTAALAEAGQNAARAEQAASETLARAQAMLQQSECAEVNIALLAHRAAGAAERAATLAAELDRLVNDARHAQAEMKSALKAAAAAPARKGPLRQATSPLAIQTPAPLKFPATAGGA